VNRSNIYQGKKVCRKRYDSDGNHGNGCGGSGGGVGRGNYDADIF
jgi:hypothetical protein